MTLGVEHRMHSSEFKFELQLRFYIQFYNFLIMANPELLTPARGPGIVHFMVFSLPRHQVHHDFRGRLGT